jgi:transposase
MLTLPPSVRVYVAAMPTDLRKSFDGLSALVASSLQHDPLTGHLYVFLNRRADQVRILFWDRTGFVVYAKRLARGRFHFRWMQTEGATHVEVEAAELALMLEGIDLAGSKRRGRWQPATVGCEAFAMHVS